MSIEDFDPMDVLLSGSGRPMGRPAVDVDEEEYDERPKSHILRLYPPDIIKKLYAHALLIDCESNNEKVDVVKEIVGDEFSELGPGTNRVGLLGPDGYCHKIALDRRGIVDNVTEFKRSPELEWVSPHVYECNGPILIAENVELLSKEEFRANKAGILSICEQLSHAYIFTDIGYAEKNFCNWGIRRNGELVVLDIGYLIPRLGNEEAMTCPICGRDLRYTTNFTAFTCEHCAVNFGFIDVYRRLTNKVEDTLYKDVTGFELPDFSQLNSTMYRNNLMKGGHIDHELGKARPATGFSLGEDVGADCIRYEDIAEILRESDHHGTGPSSGI
jgi:hypothetical protein